jgi:hypothetical protein
MRFVIIASARTGSNHLVTMLGKRKDMLCNGEVFHKNKVYVRWRKEYATVQALADLADLRRVDPKAFINRLFETGHGRPHVGFKILRTQNDEALENILTEPSIRKIILYRRNVLANYSSSLVAKLTNKWAVNDRNDPSESPKVEFKEKQFLNFHDKYIDFYRHVINRINATHQSSHLISYEEINNPWLFANVVNYIGGDSAVAKMESSYVKQNPSNIVDRFSNPKKVEEFLREKQLMHWAHEGECTFRLLDAEPREEEPPNKMRSAKKLAAETDEDELNDGLLA